LIAARAFASRQCPAMLLGMKTRLLSDIWRTATVTAAANYDVALILTAGKTSIKFSTAKLVSPTDDIKP